MRTNDVASRLLSAIPINVEHVFKYERIVHDFTLCRIRLVHGAAPGTFCHAGAAGRARRAGFVACPCHLKNPINRRRAGIIFYAPARQNAAPLRRGATESTSLCRMHARCHARRRATLRSNEVAIQPLRAIPIIKPIMFSCMDEVQGRCIHG